MRGWCHSPPPEKPMTTTRGLGVRRHDDARTTAPTFALLTTLPTPGARGNPPCEVTFPGTEGHRARPSGQLPHRRADREGLLILGRGRHVRDS